MENDVTLGIPPRRSEFERQAAIILGALLTAGVVWMASTVSSNVAAVAGLQVQIEALREQIADLKAAGKVAFGAEEAAREFARVDGRIGDLEQRLRRLEGRP